jgi:putative permease
MKAPGRSPLEPRSERARGTAATAFIWLGTAAMFWIAWQLSQALLLIFGGLVFAAGLRSGETLIKRVWNVPHAIRLTIVVLLFAISLVEQTQQLAQTLQAQYAKISGLAGEYGIHVPRNDIVAAAKVKLGGQLDRVTAIVGNVVGGLGSLLLVVTLGIYFAADPRLYERGVEWLTPQAMRAEVAGTLDAMSSLLRRWVAGRLLTMALEGILIFVGLALAGVPLAGVLAFVAGLLAFIPTLGAMISGVLIVAVGFSAGTDEGLWAVGIYLAVQLLEGNVLTPLIEKRAVDLAPAVVLGAQLLFGVLFGILGVALADPIVALAKLALNRRGMADGGTAAPE